MIPIQNVFPIYGQLFNDLLFFESHFIVNDTDMFFFAHFPTGYNEFWDVTWKSPVSPPRACLLATSSTARVQRRRRTVGHNVPDYGEAHPEGLVLGRLVDVVNYCVYLDV